MTVTDTSLRRAVRAALAAHPDGLDLHQLADATGLAEPAVNDTLRAMAGQVRTRCRPSRGGDTRLVTIWRLAGGDQ